jgi:ATP-binding cassette subfamily B multidrug efflux pump
MSAKTQQAAPRMRPMGGGMGGGPGGGMMHGAEKPKNFKATIAKLLRHMRPYLPAMMLVFILAIASTVFTIVSPKILGNVTNKIVDGYVDRTIYDQFAAKLPAGTSFPPGTTGAGLLAHAPASVIKQIPTAELSAIRALDFSTRPGIDFTSIARTAYLLIGLYLLSAAFNYAQGWVMANVAQKITYGLRRDLSNKIGRLPLRYFDGHAQGDVLSRVTNDVDTLNTSLNQSLTSIVTSVTTIIGILVMMLTISWELTLVALLVLPVSFSFIGLIIGRSQRYFKSQQDTLGKLNGHIEEMYSGHTVMKVFNGEQASVATFQKINGDLYESAWKSQFYSGLMMPIMNFVGNLGYVGVSVLGGYLAIRGTINIGDIQAFIQYVNQFNQPIVQAANIANVLQSTAAAAERVFEFLEEPDETPDPQTTPKLTIVHGAVEFKDVVFGYSSEKTIINGFTASIHPGQRIAIVGPTGAGKTTMVNLLMRFYELNSGSIEVDGVLTASMRRADVRKLFGMVLQDTWLFNGSLRENIGYGKPGATEAEIVEAAKRAHADHFIRALPKGYDMELNEEADNISQGEKQLLTIARAMLADPPMLILDEATSSVDTRTEVLIQAAMDKLMKGKTSFVIAHRLSTIRGADLILVMRDGNIVEQGTHPELLAAEGFYASLYNSQFSEGE